MELTFELGGGAVVRLLKQDDVPAVHTLMHVKRAHLDR